MANITEVMLTDIAHKSDYVRTTTGDRALVSGLENYKDALFRRLITSPGSIVHRPDYGVGIKNYQGAPLSLEKQRELVVRIEEQFLRDPRTEKVVGISFKTPPDNPSMTKILVSVKPVGYDEVEMQFTPFEG